MQPIVDVRGLRAGYGSTEVLAGFDLQIEPGEVVVVLGANGTGKTTLLRTLCSLHPAIADHATVVGHPIGGAAARAVASLAGDEPVFFTDITLVEQLDYLVALGRAASAEAYLEQILSVLGLEERRDQLPQTMSRGWRQRAALACSLTRAAPLLCIDEPFAGLDTAGRQQVVDTIDWYRGSGHAVVVATHDPDSLEMLAPRRVQLRN